MVQCFILFLIDAFLKNCLFFAEEQCDGHIASFETTNKYLNILMIYPHGLCESLYELIYELPKFESRQHCNACYVALQSCATATLEREFNSSIKGYSMCWESKCNTARLKRIQTFHIRDIKRKTIKIKLI